MPLDPGTLNCPSVWFRRLERAKNLNDFEAAAEALRQLRRLGVEVRFVPEHERRSMQQLARHGWFPEGAVECK